MYRIFTGVSLLLTMIVAGCSSLGCGDPHPYINSPSRPALKAPEGLTIPPPDPAYVVGSVTPVTGKHPERDAKGVCLIYPPQVVPTGNSAKPAAQKAPTGIQSAPPQNVPAPAKPANAGPTPAPAAGTAAHIGQWLAVIGGMQ
ncbi:MAG TPA: hypothetical protein VJS89_06460 [Gammaproteobacteria bacterium]|nr:hypothetical protein [Gammaproteobacteria bacterium]